MKFSIAFIASTNRARVRLAVRVWGSRSPDGLFEYTVGIFVCRRRLGKVACFKFAYRPSCRTPILSSTAFNPSIGDVYAVELRSGLERLTLPAHSCVLRPREQCVCFFGTRGANVRAASQSRSRIAAHSTARNHHRCREVQCVVQALDGRYAPASQDVAVSHGFHSQYSDTLFHQLRKYVVSKAAEVGIHDIKRHLAGIKLKVLLRRLLQHSEMHQRIAVPGEANVANLFKPSLPPSMPLEGHWRQRNGRDLPSECFRDIE